MERAVGGGSKKQQGYKKNKTSDTIDKRLSIAYDYHTDTQTNVKLPRRQER
ncbi:hypothetical protein [Anaerotalea alkaliphila]|uniref:Uncharacterized protein n=1 Tax=Anaerotalea alkaliphila TaxID=2662126 RepID=A0A7X5HTV3_9FIRM|nr:hypothetical protein [Anaerotalea alkaliphila]NDL66561.1 hypothetical protein [Anaerotalea alkaliphila]